MNDLLVYVLYPLTVAGVLSIFTIIYKVFARLIERMLHHEITAAAHHERIASLERHHRPPTEPPPPGAQACACAPLSPR